MSRKSILLLLLALTVVFGGKAGANLVARYTFDDGTGSDSAYYYTNPDGTFYGDAGVVEDPCRGKVLSLDGIGDYVRVENSAVAEFSTESFTYSFWAKTSTPGTWYYFWKGKNVGGQPSPDDDLHGVNCYHDDSAEVRFSLYRYDGITGHDGDIKSRTNVIDANCVNGQWVHIACVRDESAHELRFYLNAQLEPSALEGDNPASDAVRDVSNPGKLYIGCNDRSDPVPIPNEFFTGLIDDFRVYNHALTQQEVEQLWQGEPALASTPAPTDGIQNACPDAVLGWTSGEGALSHDVYFGTDAAAVRDATTSSGEFMQNTSGNSFAPSSLVPGTTYYWRIDEVVSGGQKWKGHTWKFRINDGKAHSPEPSNAKTQVPLEQVLAWQAGCFAGSTNAHKVYFGTDYDQVNDMTDPCATKNLGDESFNPGELSYSTVYYWRVDEVNGATTWKGDVWSFRTESAIFDPNLRVWYKLDETEGTDAADSSGHEYDGIVLPSAEARASGTWVPGWEPTGKFDGCYNFDDDCAIGIPTGVLSEIDKQISISVWVNSASTDDDIVCAAGAPWENSFMELEVPGGGGTVYWRAGDDTNDVLNWTGGNPASFVDAWNHFVLTKDENLKKIELYLNATKVTEETDTSDGTLVGLRDRVFKIGAEPMDDSGFEGKVDGFRVYDKVISSDEVAAIFRGGNLALAWAPTPSDGSKDVYRDAVLTWKPGDYVVQHDVYFGTSFDDVNDADTATTLVYKGRQDANSYDPPGYLELNTDYYWRIDEVNDVNIWKGNTWKFTAANFLVLDDFESYSEDLDDLYWFYGGNWLDGIDNGTGSTLYLGVLGEPTHTGKQSLFYAYQNQFAYYSEAERVINTGERDWTTEGVKILTLYFYGDPGNTIGSTDQMYVGIKDGGGTSAKVGYGAGEGEDSTDIQRADWHEWNIPLSEFTNVTLSNVTNLYIMFGESGGSTPGGSGTVYFDDIRLYPPKCVPAYGPEYDFSGNCVVDVADVGILAAQWLETDAYVATQAPTSSPVGWWKFDEGSGTSCADSSVNGNNGTIDRAGYTWVAGKIGSNALELNGARVLVPDATVLRPANYITVMAWINYAEPTGYTARVVTKGVDESNHENFAIQVGDDGFSWFVRDPNTDLFSTDSDRVLWHNEWIHLAGSYDGSAVKCYINGRFDCSLTPGPTSLQQDSNSLCIGDAVDVDRAFFGKVDDVRVYNVALPDEQIAHIATGGTGYVSLPSEFDVYDSEPAGSRAINFRDYALVMQTWLEEKLWPTE